MARDQDNVNGFPSLQVRQPTVIIIIIIIIIIVIHMQTRLWQV